MTKPSILKREDVAHMSAPETNGDLQWFKSSYSAANGACVEVAIAGATVAMRDSKDPGGPVLRFDAGAFREFVDAVRVGRFDLHR